MDPRTVEAERAAFRIWARSLRPRERYRDIVGGVFDDMWFAWHARAALDQPRAEVTREALAAAIQDAANKSPAGSADEWCSWAMALAAVDAALAPLAEPG